MMTKRYAPVKVTPQWEPKGVVASRGYDRVVIAPPPDMLPPRFPMRAPLVKRHLAVRPIAVLEAEIGRAVTPALRPEDC